MYNETQTTSTSNYEPFHPMHNTQHKHAKKIKTHPYMFHHIGVANQLYQLYLSKTSE